MGYGIVFDGGVSNQLNNAGAIGSLGGQALLGNTLSSNTKIDNTGQINGDQNFLGATEETNRAGGVIRTNRIIDLGGGGLTNDGDLIVGLDSRPRTTRFAADLVQTRNGGLHFDADFLGGKADGLAVRGAATLSGVVVVAPRTLVPGTLTVLTATGALDAGDLVDATGSQAFAFTPARAASGAGSALTITPSADFVQDGLSNDRRSLASHLQRAWDGDRPEKMAQGFAALARIRNSDDYISTLDRLASRQVGAIATARMESSRLFVNNMQSCPVFVGDGLMLGEADCAWGRAISAHLDHNGPNGAAGFDNNATLLQFGGQRRIGDNLFLTGAVGWESASLRDDFGASADDDSWMVGLGVKRQSGPLLVSATVDLGYGSFDASRSFPVGGVSFRAKGSTDARNVGLHGRVAYEVPYERFYLRPSIELDARWISLDGYNESGAGDFNLAVDENDGWAVSATPAVEIGTRIDLADGTVLRPFASAGARFVSGNDWTVDASFLGAPDSTGRFSSRVDNPNAVATFEDGVMVVTKGNLDVAVQYQGGFAGGYTAQSGALKVTWRF